MFTGSGCSIQSEARSWPVGVVAVKDLAEYQQKLKKKGVKSAARILLEENEHDTIVDEDDGWEYEDERSGPKEGYEMYNLRLQRTFSSTLKAVHVRVVRYWIDGAETIKVMFNLSYPMSNAELEGGSVNVWVDKKRKILAVRSDGHDYIIYGYVENWKSGAEPLF